VTRRIITIRPEPGCAATVAAGRAAGLAIAGWPLFDVRPRPWIGPDPQGVDGLLLGSANAIRHGGAGLDAYRGKPVWAVGGATAAAASDAGFTIAGTGPGVLQQLVDRIEGPLRLLRLAGAEHVPLRAPDGITVDTRIVYESVARPFPPELAESLPDALVLLHSAAAARHFAAEVDRMAIPRARLHLASLGPRIEDAAGEGWGSSRNAARPAEDELLALAAEMCHDSAWHGG